MISVEDCTEKFLGFHNSPVNFGEHGEVAASET